MATPQAEPLSPEQRERLRVAIAVWVENHPLPTYRAFAFGDSEPFSPVDLLEALGGIGPLARRFFRMVRFGLEGESFDGIVASFEQPRFDDGGLAGIRGRLTT